MIVWGCDEDPVSPEDTLAIARVSGNAQEGRAGAALSAPLVVVVTNTLGVAVPNQRVNFVITLGDARLSVETAVSNSLGEASTRLILGTLVGDVHVEARVYGHDSMVEFTATVLSPADGSSPNEGGLDPTFDPGGGDIPGGSDIPDTPFSPVNVLRLDGADDWVRIPVLGLDNPLSYPGAGGWSLEVLAKPASSQRVAVLCGQASTDDSPKDPYYLAIGDGTWGGTGGGAFHVQDNAGNVTSTGDMPALADVEQWIHFAGTFEDGSSQNTIRFYVNGELQRQVRTSVTIGSRASQFDPFAIGALASYGGESGFVPFDGEIDEVRVWNRTLSAEDIQANLGIELTGTEPGLVGYWNFDKLTPDGLVPDVTGNGNDGRLLFDARLVSSSE